MMRLTAFVLALLVAPASAMCRFATASSSGAFEQGMVDGRWVGLVREYGGGNGGATRAIVYTLGPGANGILLSSAGKIDAASDGDRTDALFTNGKLYVTNAIYLPGEPHCCFTHLAVQRFGFHAGRLVREGEGNIAAPEFKPTALPSTESCETAYKKALHASVLHARMLGTFGL